MELGVLNNDMIILTGGRGGFEVTTHGGRKKTNIDALKWAKKGVKNGAGEILLTSMKSDGTKKGYNLKLTKLISENVSVPSVCASVSARHSWLSSKARSYDIVS